MYLLFFGLILFGFGIAEIVTCKPPLDSTLIITVTIKLIGSIPMTIGAYIISCVLTKRE